MTANSNMEILCVEWLLNILLIIKACQSLTIYQSSGAVPYSLASPQESQTTPLRFQQTGHARIYPAQYQVTNRGTANYEANEQLVAAETKKHTKTDQLLTNYHNTVYHFEDIERTSPRANNEHWENQRFDVRKQRNLREKRDNKLIERIGEMENVNESESVRGSSKQPSTTTPWPTIGTSHEMRYLHDIFLNYPKSHHVNFGHIELSPVLFEKHFESQKAGNRYKGEIMWLDNTGSFAQHYWDLAQGRL